MTTMQLPSTTLTTKYPVVVRDSDVLVLDGFISRTDLDPETTPWSTWHKTTGIISRRPNTVVCRTKMDNVGDGFSASGDAGGQATNWVVCRLELTRVHDDAIENDGMQAGVINDCLIDGAMVFLSCRYGSSGTPPDGSMNTVHIENTLVRLWEYQNSYDAVNRGEYQHGQLFKWAQPDTNPEYGIPPRVDLVNCTFSADKPPGWGNMAPPPNCTARGTTLIWTGAGSWPSADLQKWLAIDPNLVLLNGQAHWDAVAAQWRSTH